MKTGLSPKRKMYAVCVCLHGFTLSSYFNIEPPSIDEYFAWENDLINMGCKKQYSVGPGI